MTWKRSSKIKRRFGVCVSFTLLVATIFLLLDMSFDNESSSRFIISSTYDHWEYRLNVSKNSLRESIFPNKLDHPGESNSKLPFEDRHYSEVHDYFEDLTKYFNATRISDSSVELEAFEYVIIRSNEQQYNPTLGQTMGIKLRKDATTLDKLHWGISKKSMYGENDPVVYAILHEMAMVPIRKISPKDRGTQLKLTVDYENGIKAIFKPMRYGRDVETKPEHYYFSDFERHNAEIAAFHLDRVLGFRRTFPVTGRKVNVTSEIYDLSYKELKRTFFKTQPPYNRTCFYGQCRYYCDHNHAICGDPDILEGSFVAYMPEFNEGLRDRIRHPWRRSYNAKRKAEWEENDDYCEEIRETPPYDGGRRLLDLMDLSVFDFLMGNQDRHHYEVMKIFGNESALVHVDHGRGFGRPFYDDISILTPIDQCCMLRETTTKRLIELHNGPKRLSHLMRQSLLADPVSPILWEPHLAALDRRLPIILNTLRSCIQAIQAYQTENGLKVGKSRQKPRK